MKWSIAGFIIGFVPTYLAVAIGLVADRAPARDYLKAILIALVATVIFNLIYAKFMNRQGKQK